MQEVETEWADWQLWHGVPFFVRAWYGCSDASASLTPEMRVRLAEHGGQMAPPRGWGKPLLISVWVSTGTFRPVECVYTSVCVCVCFGWRPASEWSWDVKDDTCVSAGKGVCCHCQWGWDWSTSPRPSSHSPSPSFRSSSFSSGGSCSEPHLILGQWVAGLWGIFWGSFWNVLCHSITIREQWRKWSLWL